MFKFFASVRKEILILVRDKAGLIILFLMPMVLVIIMSMLQEFGYSAVNRENHVNLLFLDLDRDSLGMKIRNGLDQSNFLKVVDSVDGKPATDSSIREAIKRGDYVIGIVIPRGITNKIRANVQLLVAKTMAGFGFYDKNMLNLIPKGKADTITVYFDPTVKNSFKNTILSSLNLYKTRIESELLLKMLATELTRTFPAYQPPDLEYSDAVEFREVFPTYKEKQQIPTTAEHNVPSWTLFAMFFIVIPLTSSMVVEREAGSQFRLTAMPVSYMQLLMAKVFVYLTVCFLQAVLMILSGVYILPLFKIVPLVLGDHIGAIAFITVMSALAALGYGVLVGTVASTHQQAAAFGAVSVIIMAALGGLWVPIILMNQTMQHVATFSPMNWGLSGFYDIFLRGGGVREILPESFKLLCFFLVMVLATYIYRKINNPMHK